MHRHRDTARFSPSRFHVSPDAFLSSAVTGGHHEIQHGEEALDLLVEDRGAATTLVVFHSALNEKASTVPVLQGHGVASSAGMNLVSVADPGVAAGDIDLAWHLGTRGTGPLRPVLAPLIQHAVRSLGTERTVLFGASGGGYSAINFGNYFPGSTVLAVNPRLDMGARPVAKVPEYLRVCHGAVSATPQRRIRAEFVTERLADSFPDGLPFDLLLFQNMGDQVYMNHQALPFIQQLSGDPRLHVRMEYTGDGHTPIPGDLLRRILAEIASTPTVRTGATV